VGARGTIGTKLNESLPNITGEFSLGNSTGTTDLSLATGCFKKGLTTYNSVVQGQTVNGSSKSFDASLSSLTYQNNAPVQQNALCINYVIKI